MHGMTLLATHSNLISVCCRSFNFIKRLQLQDIRRPFCLASSTSVSLPDTSPLLDLAIVMSSPSAAEKWEQLKNEGNVFFAQGNQDPPINHGSNNSAGAYTKYSEAIVLSPQTATLYSNRAATLIKMGKLDLAYNDAVKYLPSQLCILFQGNGNRSEMGKGILPYCRGLCCAMSIFRGHGRIHQGNQLG
jgi:hypothetical protein